MSLKVVVVEDDAVISMKIEQDLLDAGHVVLDVVHNSERALDAIHNNRPDMVLLDINIEGTRDGVEVASIINQNYDIPFIFITAYSDKRTLDRAKVTNPCGYIVKPYKTSDLHTTLTIGLFNYQSRKEQRSLNLQEINSWALSHLSEREFEILEDIVQGLTNAQIAAKQYISMSTVKWHLQNLYSKLGVKNRTSAVKKVLSI